jgi:hypothetical protein
MLKSPGPDILVLHGPVHVLVLVLVAVAGNTAAVVQQRAAETSNRHLGQRLLLQVTHCIVVAVDRRSFVDAVEEGSTRHLEQTQMPQMAYMSAAFAGEDTVGGVDSFGIVRQCPEVTGDWVSDHHTAEDIADCLGTVAVEPFEVEPGAVVYTAVDAA